MEDYLPILQALGAASVQYCVIGTWALKAYFPSEMHDFVLRDCDLVLAPGLDNVRLAIATLQAAAWQSAVWGHAIDANVSADALRDKYYVRGKKGNLVLDMTYECAAIAWPTFQAEVLVWQQIPLASVEHIATLKRLKSTPRDWECLARLGLSLPSRPQSISPPHNR
jgi:hypothetical protein